MSKFSERPDVYVPPEIDLLAYNYDRLWRLVTRMPRLDHPFGLPDGMDVMLSAGLDELAGERPFRPITEIADELEYAGIGPLASVLPLLRPNGPPAVHEFKGIDGEPFAQDVVYPMLFTPNEQSHILTGRTRTLAYPVGLILATVTSQRSDETYTAVFIANSMDGIMQKELRFCEWYDAKTDFGLQEEARNEIKEFQYAIRKAFPNLYRRRPALRTKAANKLRRATDCLDDIRSNYDLLEGKPKALLKASKYIGLLGVAALLSTMILGRDTSEDGSSLTMNAILRDPTLKDVDNADSESSVTASFVKAPQSVDEIVKKLDGVTKSTSADVSTLYHYTDLGVVVSVSVPAEPKRKSAPASVATADLQGIYFADIAYRKALVAQGMPSVGSTPQDLAAKRRTVHTLNGEEGRRIFIFSYYNQIDPKSP